MEDACFGARYPEEIWSNVSRHVERKVGSAPVAVHHYSVSIGAVLGLELSDGRRIALKVFAPWHDVTFLAAANDVRQTLVLAGYPGPRPLTGVEQFGAAYTWVEEWLEAPQARSPSEATVVLAGHLVDFLNRTSGLRADPALARSWQTHERPVGIWRHPPRPDADLTVPVPGAEWITEVAELGRSIAETAPGPKVIGHVDWRPDNVRTGPDGELAAVFDWDSVQYTHRVHILAGGCASLSPEGMGEFLGAYDARAESPLSSDERRSVAGRIIWSRAALARYELMRQLPTSDQHVAPTLERDVTSYLQAATAPS
jgi:hypothetical protein